MSWYPHLLSLEWRVKVLLIKQFVGKSNRMFANMFVVLSMISGIDILYKTIERLCSDNEVILAIHNLYVLLLKKKGVISSNATGDGRGYGLTVKKNYESYTQKMKGMAKESLGNRKENGKTKGHRKKLFIYSFNIMDLETRLYIAIGASMKSECKHMTGQ